MSGAALAAIHAVAAAVAAAVVVAAGGLQVAGSGVYV